MNPAGLAAVRSNPGECCRWLAQSGVVSHFQIELLAQTSGITLFHITFVAPDILADYPVEEVRVSVLLDGSIAAVPIGGPDRPWYHRYPRWSVAEITNHNNGPLPWLSIVGGLCLWYPNDPRRWRWTWDDGFDTYLLLVQRHLWAEQYRRRHGDWPAEDAPHGERLDGTPHPLNNSSRECA